MPKSLYFGILHPEMGLLGNPWNLYPNEQNPGEIKISDLLLFNEASTATSVRDSNYKNCEIVPITISCPEFNLPKTQSDMWDAALLFISQYPNVRMATRFRDFMVENKIITESESVLWTGFPFSTPFPKMYRGQKYEIITVAGDKLTGSVDDGKEFSSEGLQWRTNDGTKYQSGVVAWKLIQ